MMAILRSCKWLCGIELFLTLVSPAGVRNNSSGMSGITSLYGLIAFLYGELNLNEPCKCKGEHFRNKRHRWEIKSINQ